MLLGFCYWAVHSIDIALGRSGVFTPLLAGWMANLMFITFGGYLLLKLRY
jgi:lipopolysaccharide export system permease protein